MEGGRLEDVTLDFWAEDGPGRLTQIVAQLPRWGSLDPLFHAFGLISDEELRAGTGSVRAGAISASLAAPSWRTFC